MDDKSKIDALQNIYTRQKKIGAEYHNSSYVKEWEKESLDDYLHEKRFDNLKLGLTSATNYYNRMLKNISELLTKFFNKNDENTSAPFELGNELRLFRMYFKAFKEDFDKNILINSVDKYTDNWIKIADEYGIDIISEKEKINNVKLIFKNNDTFNKLENEIKYIVNSSLDLMNLCLHPFGQPKIDSQPIIAPNNLKRYNDLHMEIKSFINHPDNISNKIEYSTIEGYIKETNILNAYKMLQESINKIHEKLSANKIFLSFADKYAYQINQNNIQSFINNKNESENELMFSLDMSASQKYTNCLLFNDGSLLVKSNKNEIKVIYDTGEAETVLLDVFKAYIQFELRKTPNVAKIFSEIAEHSFSDMLTGMETIKTFKNNQNILKSAGYIVSNHNKIHFEKIDDEMNAIINEHKFLQFSNSIVSNKYRHLYNEATYDILKSLYELKIEDSILQNFIGKKLAAFRTSDDLNKAISNLFDSLDNFFVEKILEKAEKNNSPIIYNKDNIIILKINDFVQSEMLGSSSWCISRDKHYFDSYTSNEKNQYFIYNFDYSSRDNKSMTGLTLNSDGSYNTAHKKDDEYYKIDNYLAKVQLLILRNDNDNYPNMADEYLNMLKNEDVVKNKSIKPAIK